MFHFHSVSECFVHRKIWWWNLFEHPPRFLRWYYCSRTTQRLVLGVKKKTTLSSWKCSLPVHQHLQVRLQEQSWFFVQLVGWKIQSPDRDLCKKICRWLDQDKRDEYWPLWIKDSFRVGSLVVLQEYEVDRGSNGAQGSLSIRRELLIKIQATDYAY